MLSIKQVSVPDSLLEYIQLNAEKLTPDVSNYAKGRRRAWIGLEAPLTDAQQFKKAPFDFNSVLWKWLYGICMSELEFEPEIALLHVGGADCSDPEAQPQDGNGGECGIKMHRDAGYADYRAVGINLIGEATFGYRAVYPEQDRWTKQQDTEAKIQCLSMKRGTCAVFNCKNPHFAQVGPNRWCINAWRISTKRAEQYAEYRYKMKLPELPNLGCPGIRF